MDEYSHATTAAKGDLSRSDRHGYCLLPACVATRRRTDMPSRGVMS